MKKLFIFLLALLPMVAFAADKYKLTVAETEESVYEDSLVRLDVSIWDNLEVLQVIISNKSSTRMYVEWEGVKIYGSHVAFLSDRLMDINREKTPEPIVAGGVCIKLICKRYSTRIPIAEKSGDTFYLTLPLKVGNDYHDLDLKYIIKSGD